MDICYGRTDSRIYIYDIVWKVDAEKNPSSERSICLYACHNCAHCVGRRSLEHIYVTGLGMWRI